MARPRNTHKKVRRKPADKSRFSGLLWALIAFWGAGAVIALLYLIPLPETQTPAVRPPFEEPHAPPAPPSVPIPRPEVRDRQALPMAAILIDDMGYDRRIDNAFLDIEAPLSFAFLPEAPHTRELAQRASRMKRDVLVHLPLEPQNGGIDAGPGVLCLSMDFDRLIETLRRNLDSVPGAVGVNNHMGSKFTADVKAMEIVLGEIKRRGMFFVDSRTTKDSVAFGTARSMGIPAAERAVFLDHSHAPPDIRKQLRRLVAQAKARGFALAIGHPQPETRKILYEELPRLLKEVRLVPVHRIVVLD